VPATSRKEVPKVIETHHSSYEDLLSLTMTNYQISRDLLAESLEIAKRGEGELTKSVPYHLTKELSQRDQESLKAAARSNLLGAASDRVMLDLERDLASKATSNFLFYIDYGIATGLIVSGRGLERKLEACANEKQQTLSELESVRDKLEQVSTELISVRALYEDCLKREKKSGHGFIGFDTDT
jgi:hypothetical protein